MQPCGAYMYTYILAYMHTQNTHIMYAHIIYKHHTYIIVIHRMHAQT